MSQLVRLEGKHTTQNAHCALVWQDKNSSTMSSFIPTRAVVPGVGHINAVVAVPEFVVRSIAFANVICSSKAEKGIILQIC